jgi:hypothetical protein
MIVSSSPFILEDITGNGILAPNAILTVVIMYSLIALNAIQMHIVAKIIQMLNVINVIPKGLEGNNNL